MAFFGRTSAMPSSESFISLTHLDITGISVASPPVGTETSMTVALVPPQQAGSRALRPSPLSLDPRSCSFPRSP